MTKTERLRAAAALMRSRAEAAICPCGGPVCDIERGRISLEELEARFADWRRPVEHIASWHPAVALAVAEWLDFVAALVEGHDEAVDVCVAAGELGLECGCAMKDCYTCGYWHNCEHRRPPTAEALAVANAYLGET